MATSSSRPRSGLPGVEHLVLLLAVLTSLAFVLAGCSSSDGTTTAGTSGGGSDITATNGASAPVASATPVTGTITVSAAASLTVPFTAIGENFQKANPDAEVELNFDSSGTLSEQILDGAPADLFASADEANMTKLTDAGLIAGEPDVFARNQLAIVVKKGNPENITTLSDLATAGTISLCGSEVPCGAYADEVLARAGVTIPADVVTRGQNVKATLAAVAEGDADAGIVYVTDITGDGVEAVVIPSAQNAVATYPMGVLAASANQTTAEAFVAYVLSDEGRAVLEDAGFLPPS
jgi:molybdate transport system substrate-binding protein